jgi:hypothetical protein
MVVVQRGDVIDTLTGGGLSDTYFTIGPDYSSQPLSVHGGLSYRGRLQFDVSAVPTGSIVNYVRLTLTRNPAAEQRSTSGIDSASVYDAYGPGDDDISPTSTLMAPLADTSDVMVAEGSTTRGTLLLAVQKWIRYPDQNHGLVLTKIAETSELDQLMFYGGDAEPGLRPKLEIYYTTQP